MLKKFFREFLEMLEKLFLLCQMQAAALIWAKPIWGQRAAPKLGGGGCTEILRVTVLLAHACYALNTYIYAALNFKV